jgi:hypothetical protein
LPGARGRKVSELSVGSRVVNTFPATIGVFVAVMGLVQVAWYVAVIVLLYKIWTKVRHLPG